MFCGRGLRFFRTSQLTFANRVHNLNTRDSTTRGPKRREAQHGMRKAFHCSMILFHEIIEIFRVADDNRGLMRLVVVRARCRVAATLINRDFLRQPLAANRFT